MSALSEVTRNRLRDLRLYDRSDLLTRRAIGSSPLPRELFLRVWPQQLSHPNDCAIFLKTDVVH